MPATWYAGGPTCATAPAFQVQAYNDGFYILRQPACTNYEKPFLYLLIGANRALLLDTGAGGINVAAVVDSLLGAWRARHAGAHGDGVRQPPPERHPDCCRRGDRKGHVDPTTQSVCQRTGT